MKSIPKISGCRTGFTLVELLVVIAIIGVLIAMLLPAVQAAREAARRMQCTNNLKQIALGVVNYESQYQIFPISISHYDEGGVTGNGLSWTVSILPFMEEFAIYDALNLEGQAYPAGLGIMHPQNHEIIGKPLPIYNCPTDPSTETPCTRVWLSVPADLPWGSTNYAGVCGPHDMGNGSIWGGLPDCHNYAQYGIKECSGTFWRHSHLAPVTLKSFADGTSNTMIAGEVVPEFNDGRVWAMANGTFVTTHAPPNYFDYEADPYYDWMDIASFRSRHPGGLNFAFGDGHVTFINETINIEIYRGLSTRAGGEAIDSAEY